MYLFMLLLKVTCMDINQDKGSKVKHSSSKEEVLKRYLDWCNERVFPNQYALSRGINLFQPEEFNNFYKLKLILQTHLSDDKQYHSRCLNFVTTFSNSILTIINFEDLYTAVRLMEDELIEFDLDTMNSYNENYFKYKKILLARYNNNEFDNNLLNILYSDPKILDAFFRYVLNVKLQDIELNERWSSIVSYINTHNTKEIIDSLETIKIPEPHYSDFKNNISALISSSIESISIKICFDNILQNDTITKILTDIKSKTKDQLLNELISKAKQKWIQGHTFDVIRDLWDILERIKTILSSDKKNGIKQLINKVGVELFPENENALKDIITIFNDEFNLLTRIGNDYTIRHPEKNKYEIHDKPRLLVYLIKRVSALLELFLSTLSA